MRTKKIAFFIVVIIVIALSFPFVGQGTHFLLHFKDIESIVKTASAPDRRLPPSVRDLLMISLENKTAPYATRLLMSKFDSESYEGAIHQQISYVSWCALLSLGFSEQDQLTIISSMAPTGGGHSGLNNSAIVLFGRPLPDISLEQAATLIVLVKWPSLYGKPERVSLERDKLLIRYQRKKM